MKPIKSVLAVTELLLVLPAALFMSALFFRSVQPQQYEPAHTAQRIVDWFAASPHLGLAVLLIALPLAVLLVGAVTLLRAWKSDAQLRRSVSQVAELVRGQSAVLLMVLATVAAGSILAVVALHMIAD